MSHHKEVASHKKDRLQLISEIAASIGHEIGNPLAVIRGYLQILQKKTAPELQNYLSTSLKELDQISCLVNTFLHLAKDTKSELKRQNLNQIILTICPLIVGMLKKNNISLDLNLSENLPDLMIQERDLQQVLLRLVQHNMAPNSSLQITTTLDNDTIQLIIFKKGLPASPALDLTICSEILANYHARLNSHWEETSGQWLIRFPLT